MKTATNPNGLRGAEKRLAKKQALENARRQKVLNIVSWVLIAVMVLALVVLLVVRMNANKYDTNPNNYFDDNGLIKKFDVLKNTELPEFEYVDIYDSVVAPTYSEVSDIIYNTIDEYVASLPEDQRPEDLEFDDDFVKNCLKLNETAEEYRARITEEMTEENFRKAAVSVYVESADVFDMPEKLYSSIAYYLTSQDMQTYSMFAAAGLIDAIDFYDYKNMSEDEYLEYIDDMVYENLFTIMVYQAVYEKYKLQPTEEEYKAYVQRLIAEMEYDEKETGVPFEKQYSKNVIMKSYIGDVVEDYIIAHVDRHKNVTGNDEGAAEIQ